MRHEAEIKSNAYWLGLLAHLQATSVPRKVKKEKFMLTLSCLGVFMEEKYMIDHYVDQLSFLIFKCCKVIQLL